ncbi:hypothetical protein D8Y22_07440 [Salinadaptatus halalkaliphilus]|uniref:DUF7982 domain-containing protein n=1 Tax=Salinadaptatus halalkaliphilus TaxID=2419781 RepID=A0A4S3TLL4_9EURY|nr:hypothetical protein [Salinadaptatus halalkaliphilus]THE65052.1 hypothetical protein D8Y22_07440 [Salinadaptatus halalkaliphilus]
MSTTDYNRETTDGSRPAEESDVQRTTEDRVELAARIELLEAENRRLRSTYARVRHAQYRKRALGLFAISIVAVGGGLIFPAHRDVLFALGATGAFGAVLTYYLSPGAFVAADVGERIYAALASNQAALAGELGLSETRLYVPAHAIGDCRLFVPRYHDYELPTHEGPIVTDEDARGLVLEPTGGRLFEAFQQALTTDLSRTPSPLAAQLADGLVEQFELADGVDPQVDPSQVTFAVTDSAVRDLDRFDHPVASFLAVGMATGLEQPVDLTVTRGDGRADWLVTCRWDIETALESRTIGPTDATAAET